MQTVLTGKKAAICFFGNAENCRQGRRGFDFVWVIYLLQSATMLWKKNIGWKQQKKTAVFSLNHQHGCIHRGTDTYVCIYMYVNMKHVAKAGRDWHRWSWCCHLVFFHNRMGWVMTCGSCRTVGSSPQRNTFYWGNVGENVVMGLEEFQDLRDLMFSRWRWGIFFKDEDDMSMNIIQRMSTMACHWQKKHPFKMQRVTAVRIPGDSKNIWMGWC